MLRVLAGAAIIATIFVYSPVRDGAATSADAAKVLQSAAPSIARLAPLVAHDPTFAASVLRQAVAEPGERPHRHAGSRAPEP